MFLDSDEPGTNGAQCEEEEGLWVSDISATGDVIHELLQLGIGYLETQKFGPLLNPVTLHVVVFY